MKFRDKFTFKDHKQKKINKAREIIFFELSHCKFGEEINRVDTAKETMRSCLPFLFLSVYFFVLFLSYK